MTISLKGGFHNVSETKIRVENSIYRLYALGRIEFNDMLTEYQEKKLSKHFCGIKGCTCDSYRDAEIETF